MTKKYRVKKKRPDGPEVWTERKVIDRDEWGVHLERIYVETELVNEYLEEVKEESKVPDDLTDIKYKGEYYILNWIVIDWKIESKEEWKIYSDKCNRPTQELAEACLALSQLAQLRNETRRRCDNWEPDWKNWCKYAIRFFEEDIDLFNSYYHHYFLFFPTPEVRDEFLEKHRDLIEQAKPLL